jgi:hypothetical protein
VCVRLSDYISTFMEKDNRNEKEKIHFCNSDNWNKYNLVQEMQDDFKINGSRIISSFVPNVDLHKYVKVQ